MGSGDDDVDREAKRAIREIEDEVERERPGPRVHAPHRAKDPTHKSFVDRAWEKQDKVEARIKRIGHGRYSRVLKMARKPEHEEFVRASQITGIGIMVIGLVGFLIFLFTSWIWGLLGVR